MDELGEALFGSTLIKLPLKRLLIIILALIGLMLVYLFQNVNIGYWVFRSLNSPNLYFIVNRTVRLLFNDVFMLLIIYAWFQDKSVMRLAIGVQLIDFLILLPIYLFLKLTWEGDAEISSPLLSQFHRLIVNPTLMILLFPAVYFQRMLKKNE